jgi:hypothetical protein
MIGRKGVFITGRLDVIGGRKAQMGLSWHRLAGAGPKIPVDKHFLTPLFSPASVAVFSGRDEGSIARTPQARALVDALTGQRFSGNLTFLDIHTSGTLADLAQTRADLAVIALPAGEEAAAGAERDCALLHQSAPGGDEARQQFRVHGRTAHHPGRRGALDHQVTHRKAKAYGMADVARRPRETGLQHQDAQHGASEQPRRPSLAPARTT